MTSLEIFTSVIVPTYNDLERLIHCIEALENQTLSRHQYEIIVVDNGSSDGTYDTLKKWKGIIAIQEEKRSSYAARNAGIAISKGEVLAFTDSDCIPASDWLEKGISHLLAVFNCGFIGGNIKLFFQDPDHLTPVELYESITGLPQKRYVNEYHFAATANMFTYKKVIDKVGIFDSKLKSRGDFEWGQRVFKAGYNISFAKDSCVLHPARHSLSQMLKKSSRVFGGIYDMDRKTKSQKKITLIKAFIYQLKPPFRKINKINSNPKLKNSMEKVLASSVELVLHYYKVLLLIKLLLGKETAR